MNCITNRLRNIIKKKILKKTKKDFILGTIDCSIMQSSITKCGNSSGIHKNKVRRVISRLMKRKNNLSKNEK